MWVIDPIDGTRNFIDGVPEFGVMVALVRRRKTVASWIHDPNSGDTLAAEQGGGVWLNGKKMRLAGHDAAIPKIGVIGSRLKNRLSKPDIAPLLREMPVTEVGSAAAFDYGRLFIGDSVFAKSTASRAAFLLYRQSKPWDHVPGLFMLDEVGGYAADLLGNPYDMAASRHGLLLAPDRALWAEFHRAFKPAFDVLIKP